jgi:asparagine synthase (glutamine-hydrolysing)
VCGLVAARGGVDPAVLEGMLDRIRHRGPDGRGAARAGDALLGHVRLAIVDVEGGRQPLRNEAGDLAVALNGEIYNHLALRAPLEGRHRFATRSDTEVLVHLWEEVGEDVLPRLDGMFAVAIAGPRGLLLARDPLGIKPLYWAEEGGVFLAASEMKAFPPVRGIRALPAGHALRAGGGPWRFASPLEVRDPLRDLPLPEVLATLRRLLGEAVEKRLMGDVPVGVLLSGGLDSSIVAALMRRGGGEVHSFAAGLRGAPDLEAARRVADHLGTVHHEAVYTEEDVRESVPEVVRLLESFDAPLVRSAIPCWFVSRLAARHVKVVLTGEGADELFAGYSYLAAMDPGALGREIRAVADRLQDTNLQRTDRMTMAHGIEGRVPFLDLALVRFALRLPPALVAPGPGRPEKWLLREAFADLLPADIVRRPKLKFSEGAGSARVLAGPGGAGIGAEEFAREREPEPGLVLRSPEELLFYREWRRAMGSHVPASLVGRTRDPAAGVEG